jgi:hypothetical protein
MSVLDLLQTVAIVFSILLGVWQVRAHMKQLRLDQMHKFYDGFNEFNMIGFNHTDYFAELNEPYNPETATSQRTYWLMGYIYTKFEQTFIQYYEYGTLSKEAWEGVAPMMLLWLRTKFGRGWWDTNIVGGAQSGEDEFVNYMNSLLRED